MSMERIESVVSRSLAAAQFFLIPAFAGCVMLSEDIFRFVFHESSTVGPLVLIILSFEKTVQSSAAIIRRSLNAVDAPDRAAFVALVTTIVLGSLLVVLVPPFGIVGAAVATTVGFSLGSVMYYRQISVYLTIELPVGLVVWSAVSATVMAATLHGLQAAFPIHSTGDLVIHIVSGAGIYLLISTTIPLLRREAIRPGLNAIS
jgi:O-antigen/teichoic acid export membrane protein